MLLIESCKVEFIEKIVNWECFSCQDGEDFYVSDDFVWFGGFVYGVCIEKNGDIMFFNVNWYLNFINVCMVFCVYCSFQCKFGQKDVYTMCVEEVVEVVLVMKDDGFIELHIVNGLYFMLFWKYYLCVLCEFKQVLLNVVLKCFIVIEIYFFEEIFGLLVDVIFDEFIDVGFELFIGGGVEIFDWDVCKQIVDYKMYWEDWLCIYWLVYQKGLCMLVIMFYGYIEEWVNVVCEVCVKFDQDFVGDDD